MASVPLVTLSNLNKNNLQLFCPMSASPSTVTPVSPTSVMVSGASASFRIQREMVYPTGLPGFAATSAAAVGVVMFTAPPSGSRLMKVRVKSAVVRTSAPVPETSGLELVALKVDSHIPLLALYISTAPDAASIVDTFEIPPM